jgi:putative FmdB family regulatory protein
VPLYEYVCNSCAHQFEELVFGKATPACRSCGSADVEKQMSVVAVGRSRGSEGAAAAQAVSPCGRCGDPRGAGSCARN